MIKVMKKSVLFVLSVAISITLFAQYPQNNDKNWFAVIQDDFSAFNAGFWVKRNNGLHNFEPQVYVQNNAYISNGNLVLETKKENYACPKGNGGCPGCNYTGTDNYTSGQIST